MPSEPTLSDGTAGGIEAGAITFPLCRAVVDEWVEVTEEGIAAAMRVFIDSEQQPIEGAAGVAIAALLARREDVVDKNVAVIICGGNVSEEVLQSVRGRTGGG
jgi:threonine dehydratase